jgi:hypothetical protein
VVETLALLFHPVEDGARAVDRVALLVADDREDDRAVGGAWVTKSMAAAAKAATADFMSAAPPAAIGDEKGG